MISQSLILIILIYFKLPYYIIYNNLLFMGNQQSPVNFVEDKKFML